MSVRFSSHSILPHIYGGTGLIIERLLKIWHKKQRASTDHY